MKLFFGWMVLILLAFVAQSFILSQHLLVGMLLFELAGVGLYVGYYVFVKPHELPRHHPAIQWDILWIPMALAFMAALAAAGWMWNAVHGLGSDPRWDGVLYTWLAFILLLLVAAGKPIYHSIVQSSWREGIPLLGLAGLSLCLGLYRLTEVPYTVHGDEGMVGLYALQVVEGNIPTFFSTAWYSLPQFFFWVPSIGMWLFGDTLFGLRFSSVLVGLLSVVSFYCVCRQLWGGAAALFSGMLLIFNHWFIHLNHSGVSYIQALWFAITAFCLLHFMNQKRSIAFAVLGGWVLGLGLMSYQANHLLPILWIVSQVWLFLIREVDWKWLLLSIVIPLAIAVLVLSPLLIYQNAGSTEQEMFTQRAEGVGIWTSANRAHLDGVYRADGNTALILREQVKRALLAPMLYSDRSIQYNGSKPMLDWITASLWGMSAVTAFLLLWKSEWALPLIWTVGILLAGGALTVDAPFFPRLTGATGLCFLLIAAMFGTVYRALDEKPIWQYLAYGVSFIVVVAAAWINFSYYFHHFATEISPANIHAKQTRLGYFMREHCGEKQVLFVAGSHTSTNSGTCRFLAKDCRAKDLHTLPEQPDLQNTIVVIDASQVIPRSRLKEQFPTAIEREHFLPGGQSAFFSYTVEAAP